MCGLGRGGSGSVPLPQSAGAQGCLCRKADSLPNFSPGPWGRGNRRAQPQRGWGAARAPPGAAGRGSRRCRTPALRAGELPGFAERPSGGSAPGKRKKETEDEGGQGETREAGDSEREQGRGRARAGTARAVSAPRQRTAPAGAECAPSPAAEVAGGEQRRGRERGVRGLPSRSRDEGERTGGQRRSVLGPAGSMWRPGTAAAAEGHGEEGASHGSAPRLPPASGRDEEGGAEAARRAPAGGGGGSAGAAPPSPLLNPAPGRIPGSRGASPPSQCA